MNRSVTFLKVDKLFFLVPFYLYFISFYGVMQGADERQTILYFPELRDIANCYQ